MVYHLSESDFVRLLMYCNNIEELDFRGKNYTCEDLEFNYIKHCMVVHGCAAVTSLFPDPKYVSSSPA